MSFYLYLDMNRREYLATTGVSLWAGVGPAVARQRGGAPASEWTERFDRGGTDTATAVTDTADGGYLFAGQTVGGSGDRNAWVLKADGTGTKEWERTFGGAAADWLSAAAPGGNGYVVAGQTASNGNGQLDAWLLKLDADGTEQWQRPYGDTLDDRASSVLADGSDYVFAGGTKSEGSGGVDAWIMKVDSDGDEVWNKVYGGAGTDWAFDHVGTDDGGYLLVGETDSAGAGGRDAWVLKTDDAGTAQWNTVYGGGRDDYARAVVPAHGDGYVFAGGSKSSGAGGTDGWLVEIGPDGTQRWESRFGDGDDDRLVSLVRHRDGYLAVGSTASSGRGAQSTWAVKVDADGTSRWETTYATGETDYANAVTGGDDPLIAGTVESGGSSSARLVKLSGTTTSVQPAVEVTPTDPGTGETVTFDAGGSTAPAGATYEWDLDGDGRFERRGRTVTEQFDSPGDYEVSLRIRAGNSQRQTTETVSVVETVSLTPQSLEPVQVVADTRVNDSAVSMDIPDPDMVADRPTALLFTVDADNSSALARDDEVTVTITQTKGDGSTTETTGTLLGETIQRITRSDQPSMNQPVEQAFQSAPADRRTPVFTLDADTETIDVSLSAPGGGGSPRVEGRSDPIVAGTDFTLVEMEPLTVGFIGIQSPRDDTGAYGDSDGRIKQGSESDSRAAFEAIVDECVDYVRRTFPVPDVESVTHPSYLDGTTNGLLPKDYTGDLKTAHDRLQSEFPDTEFDATLAILPEGYFDYHGKGSATGIELTGGLGLGQPQAAVGVEQDTERIKDVASTAAQEIGHHLHGDNPYPDEMAMRTEGLVSDSLDNQHARTEEKSYGDGSLLPDYFRDFEFDEAAVRSSAYDFANGSYTLLREAGDEGFWSGTERPYYRDDKPSLTSFMSYSYDDTWADGYFYQMLIDRELEPKPPVEVVQNTFDSILSGTGYVDDEGELRISDTTKRVGRPTPSVDGDVAVELKDGSESVVNDLRTEGSIQVLGHGSGNETLDGLFTFAVPFPDETAEVTVAHEGKDARTTFNPVERTLHNAIRNVPDRGFTSNPDERRESLLSTVATINEQMDSGEYGAARDSLATIRSDIESWLKQEYETTAGEYTRAEVLELVADMERRLGTVESSTSPSMFPSWAPIAGGAGLGALGGSAALYKYLTGDD